MKNKITFQNFHRQRFIRLQKKKLNYYIIFCKLFQTKKHIEAVNNNNKIIDIINRSVKIPKIFEINNFYYILSIIQECYDFMEQFKISVHSISDVDMLADSHNTFLKKQNDIIQYLNKNFENPKRVSDEELEKMLQEK